MNQEERELYENSIADFRYGIISELVNPYLSRGSITALIKKKAEMKYQIPYSDRTVIKASCIKKWLFLFRKYGKDALKPKRRKDRGRSKALTEIETDLILKKLEEKPELTASSVVKLLQKDGKLSKEVSKSSLSRLIIASGFTRENRIKDHENETALKFNFFYPLECVQADDMHAFSLPDKKGKFRKAILIAFIDDATRRIVYANFSFTERSISFETGIRFILKSHGNIGQIYVDNGSTFISNQTKRICDCLGIKIYHSRPGIPKGRGKIERFFRTVREQFLRPLEENEIKSLSDLNIRFHTWLESEYHRSPHKGLSNKTPIDAWLSNAKFIIRTDPLIDIDRAFYHMHYRKVYKDSTFTLNGTLYEAPSILCGAKITLFYDPVPEYRHVFIQYDNKDFGEVRPVNTYANAKVIRNVMTHQIAYQPDIDKLSISKEDAKSFPNLNLSITQIDMGEKE
jgi:putative transposase